MQMLVAVSDNIHASIILIWQQACMHRPFGVGTQAVPPQSRIYTLEEHAYAHG